MMKASLDLNNKPGSWQHYEPELRNAGYLVISYVRRAIYPVTGKSWKNANVLENYD